MHVPEGWRKTKIADIAHIQVGRDLNESAYSEIKTNEYRFPVYSNTVENRGLYGYYNFEEYPGNSVTIVGRGIGLGTAFSRKKGRGFGAIGRLLVVNPIHNSFDVDFFANYVNFRLIIFNESGGIPQLPGSQIAKYHVVLPPLPEQQKIAQILSTWDKAIEKLHTLITAKQKRKKALMQQLLTGKKRFAGFREEWEEVFMCNVFNRIIRKNTEVNTNVVTISAQKGLIKQDEFFNKSVSSETLDDYFLLKKGEFAYNKSYSNGYPMGAIKRLNNYDKAVVTTLYICFEIKDLNFSCSSFFEHYFESGRLVRGLIKVANEGGRAHGLLNVTPKDFFELKIFIPKFPEQQKIASVLSAADKEIETHQKELSALKQQKKGLMQQLLTGKKRVKIDEPVQQAAVGA